MVDFTMTGDTWITLEGQDPMVAREAYVRKILPVPGISDYRDPVISPHLDENLADGMPPTLLQTGGKEVLLSHSLIMFQALEAAGQVASSTCMTASRTVLPSWRRKHGNRKPPSPSRRRGSGST